MSRNERRIKGQRYTLKPSKAPSTERVPSNGGNEAEAVDVDIKLIVYFAYTTVVNFVDRKEPRRKSDIELLETMEAGSEASDVNGNYCHTKSCIDSTKSEEDSMAKLSKLLATADDLHKKTS